MKANKPEECNTLLAKAFNMKDMSAVMSLFEKEAIFTDEKGEEHVASKAIAEAEQKVIDLNPDFQIETIKVTVFENIAVLRSKWHLKGTSPEGKPVELAHNGIEVVGRQSDGSWQHIIDNPFFAD